MSVTLNEATHRSNAFNRKFVELAEQLIPTEMFAMLVNEVDILLLAEIKPKEVVEPVRVPVPMAIKQKAETKKSVMEHISAAVNDRKVEPVVPHAVERVKERLDINIGAYDVAELTSFILRGGPNVTKIKREMRAVDHYRVNWRDKEFAAIISPDRRELITVRLINKNTGKKNTVKYADKPRREKQLQNGRREQMQIRNLVNSDQDGE